MEVYADFYCQILELLLTGADAEQLLDAGYRCVALATTDIPAVGFKARDCSGHILMTVSFYCFLCT
jgi:hypothetical protein